VLVVDDVDATRHGLAELLRLRGYSAHEAKNGAEGIEVLREHPDTGVVVLDLTMPGTNGFWFREQQLKEPALAHIPVIVFTGSAEVEQLRRLAVEDVLLKPFSVDDLFEAIERHCAGA
jgi:CheY-like chemotaxis protein